MFSWANCRMPAMICFWLAAHLAVLLVSIADLLAPNPSAAKTAMIAMTTSNSIKVKPQRAG